MGDGKRSRSRDRRRGSRSPSRSRGRRRRRSRTRSRSRSGSGGGGANVDPRYREIQKMVLKRQEARRARDFAEADRLRDELRAMGVATDDDSHTWAGPDGLCGTYTGRTTSPPKQHIDPELQQIVQIIKRNQRADEDYKRAWIDYNLKHGRGNNDPQRHPVEYLHRAHEACEEATRTGVAIRGRSRSRSRSRGRRRRRRGSGSRSRSGSRHRYSDRDRGGPPGGPPGMPQDPRAMWEQMMMWQQMMAMMQPPGGAMLGPPARGRSRSRSKGRRRRRRRSSPEVDRL